MTDLETVEDPAVLVEDPLVLLEQVLETGALAAAIHQKAFGSQLAEAAEAVSGLEATLEGFDQVVPVAEFLAGHLESDDLQDLNDAALTLQLTAGKLATVNSKEGLQALVFDVKSAHTPLGEVTKILKRAFETYVTSAFGSFAQMDEVLRICQVDEGLRQQIETLAQNGLATKKKFPPDSTTLSSIGSFISERDRLRQELASSAGSEEVTGFLLALVEKRATLADVPPDVWQWLQSHGALNRFSVSLTET